MKIEDFHPKIVAGVELNGAGKPREAIDALEEGLEAQPDVPKAWYLLGGLYWQLGEYTRSIAPRRRAIQLRPRREIYSLGLFHTLLDAGLADELVVEVRRFLAEVDNGAKCSEQTRALYATYAKEGAALVAEWKRVKNS